MRVPLFLSAHNSEDLGHIWMLFPAGKMCVSLKRCICIKHLKWINDRKGTDFIRKNA